MDIYIDIYIAGAGKVTFLPDVWWFLRCHQWVWGVSPIFGATQKRTPLGQARLLRHPADVEIEHQRCSPSTIYLKIKRCVCRRWEAADVQKHTMDIVSSSEVILLYHPIVDWGLALLWLYENYLKTSWTVLELKNCAWCDQMGSSMQSLNDPLHGKGLTNPTCADVGNICKCLD